MQFKKTFQIMPWEAERGNRAMEHAATQEVAQEILKQMEPGAWYTIKIEIRQDQLDPLRKTVGIDLERIRQKIMVIPTLEERALRPAATRREKLKNCIRYMQGKM